MPPAPAIGCPGGAKDAEDGGRGPLGPEAARPPPGAEDHETGSGEMPGNRILHGEQSRREDDARAMPLRIRSVNIRGRG